MKNKKGYPGFVLTYVTILLDKLNMTKNSHSRNEKTEKIDWYF